jgi:hypothetical protein
VVEYISSRLQALGLIPRTKNSYFFLCVWFLSAYVRFHCDRPAYNILDEVMLSPPSSDNFNGFHSSIFIHGYKVFWPYSHTCTLFNEKASMSWSKVNWILAASLIMREMYIITTLWHHQTMFKWLLEKKRGNYFFRCGLKKTLEPLNILSLGTKWNSLCRLLYVVSLNTPVWNAN